MRGQKTNGRGGERKYKNGQVGDGGAAGGPRLGRPFSAVVP